MRDDREFTRLAAVLEPGDGARERLSAVIQAVPLACVMFQIGSAGAERAGELAELLMLARAAGVVCLIVDEPELARELSADGVHLSGGADTEERFAAARAILSPDSAVGVDAGGSRHMAMTVGEAGADYIAFGPETQLGDGQVGAQSRLDLIAWWAEVFELPCVAMDVTSAGDARDLALAGADFVALSLPAGRSPAWAAEQARAFAAALDEAARLRVE